MSVDKRKLLEFAERESKDGSDDMGYRVAMKLIISQTRAGRFKHVCPDCGGTEINVMCDDPYYAEPCVCTVDLMADNLKLCAERDELRKVATATVDFWKRIATDQQALKEKAQQGIEFWKGMYNAEVELRQQTEEERDHLLAANDEYQEKLRFEDDDESRMYFKIEDNGSITTRRRGDGQ